MKNRQKMTKDTIPEGFPLPLVLVDVIPVVLFGVNLILAGSIARSVLILIFMNAV